MCISDWFIRRMTEVVYDKPIESFTLDIQPSEVYEVEILTDGRKALEKVNVDMGNYVFWLCTSCDQMLQHQQISKPFFRYQVLVVHSLHCHSVCLSIRTTVRLRRWFLIEVGSSTGWVGYSFFIGVIHCSVRSRQCLHSEHFPHSELLLVYQNVINIIRLGVNFKQCNCLWRTSVFKYHVKLFVVWQ